MSDLRGAILEAMVVAILTDIWVETPEGSTVTENIADEMPAAPLYVYHAAYLKAAIYYGRVWQLWNYAPNTLLTQNAEFLQRDPEEYARKWAHYAVLESLGRKVSWSEIEEPITFAMGQHVEEDLADPGCAITLEDDMTWEVDWVTCPDDECAGEAFGDRNDLEAGDTVHCVDCGCPAEVIADGDGDLSALSLSPL